ncbi:DUF4174 domain-containing protein [Fodinibius salsisoli]|uniref:DUF4174 domain-containing protein n=1 Tax=Fodinibius salsisoli TaxID=2820877 RepID=A0ABT3PRX2_9BACT|nr:DUF4174 domain-containing protein [Fodinibius salsisoli]MCW9708605.1 DUF4174 domain-containing protein [Fodinibius salsisoli]
MLKQISGIILFLIVPATFLMAQNSHSPADLDQYQWENRLLLIFAPSDTSDFFHTQISEFEGRKKGFHDRDLKTLYLLGDGTSQVEGEPISVLATEQLYEDYNVPENTMTVILIGKDGTEKLRTGQLLTILKLFSVIDAMPMRKQEMNGGS